MVIKEVFKTIGLLKGMSIIYFLLSVFVFIRFNIITGDEEIGLAGLFFITTLIPGVLVLLIDFLLNKMIKNKELLISLKLGIFIMFLLFWIFSFKSLFL